MRIGRQLIEEVIAHSQDEAPNECCGLIGGSNGQAATVYRARNEFESPLRYNVHPEDLLRITNEIADRGEELTAIYHSHTGSDAYPSQTDINLAENWPDPVYLICSLAEAEPEVRGFEIRDGAVEEVELDVE